MKVELRPKHVVTISYKDLLSMYKLQHIPYFQQLIEENDYLINIDSLVSYALNYAHYFKPLKEEEIKASEELAARLEKLAAENTNIYVEVEKNAENKVFHF